MEFIKVHLTLFALAAMSTARIIPSDHVCYSRIILDSHRSFFDRQDCDDMLNKIDQKVTTEENDNISEELDCNGWNSWGGSVYRLIDSKQSWHESNLKCKEEYSDGHLLYIENEEENDVVWELTSNCTTNLYLWIGLYDGYEEGEWKWGTKEVENFNWGYYNGNPEPSEGQPWSSLDEDCGLIGSETGKWFDVLCSFPYAAICEREISNTEDDRK